MENKNLQIWLVVLIFLFVGVSLIGKGLIDSNINFLQKPNQSSPGQIQGINTSTDSAQIDTSEDQLYQVVKVVDGDTIEVQTNQGVKNVRLVGINTPETVDPRRPVQCFGKESSDETKSLLTGKKVILTKDVSDVDKYDRWLRFVYLPLEDGTSLFVNDYLVREGFAQSYPYPPDVKFDSQFREAEREAREGNRGLWGVCKS